MSSLEPFTFGNSTHFDHTRSNFALGSQGSGREQSQTSREKSSPEKEYPYGYHYKGREIIHSGTYMGLPTRVDVWGKPYTVGGDKYVVPEERDGNLYIDGMRIASMTETILSKKGWFSNYLTDKRGNVVVLPDEIGGR